MYDQGRRYLERDLRLSLNFADQSRIDESRAAGFLALRRNVSDHYLQDRFDYVITRLSRTLHRLRKNVMERFRSILQFVSFYTLKISIIGFSSYAVIIVIDRERYLYLV